MDILLKMVSLLAVAAGTSAAEYQCVYAPAVLDCTDAGLTTPPPGLWPGVVWLLLGGNPITDLPRNSLTGFPDVQYLYAPDLQLTALDLEELASMTQLKELNFEFSAIERIVAPAEEEVMENLEAVFIYANRVNNLDPDVLQLVPNLVQLSMNENPIVVEPGQPLINHPNLQQLWVGMGTSFGDVDGSLLSGLPNLRHVTLIAANITSVQGAFVNNPQLTRIVLDDNKITQITSGTFASTGVLYYLSLDNNPLKRLDTAALSAAMGYGGVISVANTPLACDCLFEALFWWASARGVVLDTSCGDREGCAFARRHSLGAEKLTKEQRLGINSNSSLSRSP